MFGEVFARLLRNSETTETPQVAQAAEEAWARARGKRAISFGKHDLQILINLRNRTARGLSGFHLLNQLLFFHEHRAVFRKRFMP